MGDIPADYFDEMDDGEPEELDPLEEALSECGLGDDGQCRLAGSEWCDFTCPMRDTEYFAGSEAWMKKHRRPRNG